MEGIERERERETDACNLESFLAVSAQHVVRKKEKICFRRKPRQDQGQYILFSKDRTYTILHNNGQSSFVWYRGCSNLSTALNPLLLFFINPLPLSKSSLGFWESMPSHSSAPPTKTTKPAIRGLIKEVVPNNTVILYNHLAALATPCFLHQMHRPQGVEGLDSRCLQESTSALIRRTKSPATRSHVSRCGSGQRKTFIPRPTRRKSSQSPLPPPSKLNLQRIFHLLLQISPAKNSSKSLVIHRENLRQGHNTILRLYWGLRPWISTFWRLDDIPIIYKGETPFACKLPKLGGAEVRGFRESQVKSSNRLGGHSLQPYKQHPLPRAYFLLVGFELLPSAVSPSVTSRLPLLQATVRCGRLAKIFPRPCWKTWRSNHTNHKNGTSSAPRWTRPASSGKYHVYLLWVALWWSYDGWESHHSCSSLCVFSSQFLPRMRSCLPAFLDW